MKNASRNRLLLCFRPVVDMEIVLDPRGVVDQSAGEGLPYIRVEDGVEMKGRPTPKRTFSQVVKAVMFETILIKRVRDRQVYRKDSSHSKRSLSMKSESFHDSGDDKSVNRVSVDAMIDQEVESDSGLSDSSPSGSSSCSSLISSETNKYSRSFSDIPKNQDVINHQDLAEKPKTVDKCCSSFYSGISLLVISLVVTILWGKLCAIVFTSVFLFFVPRRHVGYVRQESVTKLAKTQPREYKKKIIMEGILERNHHRRHYRRQNLSSSCSMHLSH